MGHGSTFHFTVACSGSWLEAPAHLLAVNGQPIPSPLHVESPSPSISPAAQHMAIQRSASAPADNPHSHLRAVLSALVVHPNARTSNLLCSTLRLWGITVQHADSVEAACRLLQQSREVSESEGRVAEQPAQLLLIDWRSLCTVQAVENSVHSTAQSAALASSITQRAAHH